MTGNPEIGRELKPSELVPHTIVVVMKETGTVAASVRVLEVLPEMVFFAAGEIRTVFGTFRTGETLTDGAGAIIKVYEYLGEP